MKINDKITGIEIENPYRYRAYTVGEEAMYDIQNNQFQSPNNERVIAITYNNGGMVAPSFYIVEFENHTHTEIMENMHGLIVHYAEEEVSEDD